MQARWWDKPVCFLCDFWWVVLILLAALTAILVSKNYWLPMLAFEEVSNAADRAEAQNELNYLNEEEMDAYRSRLLAITDAFSSPETRPYSAEFFALPVSLEQSESLQGRTQVLNGVLSQVTLIEDLKPGWPDAYLFTIEQGENDIICLYRGDVSRLQVGVPTTAEGIYVIDGQGMLIDHIHQTEQNSSQTDNGTSFPWFWVAVSLSGLWMFFVLYLLTQQGKKQNKPSYSLALIVLTGGILLSGCNLNIQTVVEASGKGYVLTQICDEIETFQFIRAVPDATAYLDDRIVNLRNDGGLFEDFVSGEQECYLLQLPFSGYGNIGNPLPEDEGDIDTWVYLDSRVLGQSKRTRYTARIDTGSLYTFYPSINSMIQKEMADALNEIPLRFSVVLPGEIVYHNGDRKIGNEIVWEIPMGEAKELVVESDMEMAGFYEQSSQTNSDVTQTNQNFLKWLIPGGIFLLSTLIFVIKSKNSINEN